MASCLGIVAADLLANILPKVLERDILLWIGCCLGASRVESKCTHSPSRYCCYKWGCILSSHQRHKNCSSNSAVMRTDCQVPEQMETSATWKHFLLSLSLTTSQAPTKCINSCRRETALGSGALGRKQVTILFECLYFIFIVQWITIHLGNRSAGCRAEN